MIKKLLLPVFAACLAASAEVDVCGNEITTYVENGVTKEYRFIVSGDPRIDIGTEAVSAASHNRVSTSDDGSGVALSSGMLALATVFESALEARCRTFLDGNGTRLDSTKFKGVVFLFK